VSSRRTEELPASPLGPVLQRLLYAAALLVFLAGIQLFVLSDQTETFFAWTVDPPLTAAFLGALYWAACGLEFMSARSGTWAGARITVPGVLVFTALTNGPTWMNLGAYNLDSPAAWGWIGVYMLVPGLFLWALVAQRKHGWKVPPRRRLLGAPLQWILGLAGVCFLAGGLAMIVAPEWAGAGWPWDLSPSDSVYKRFTEPYVGCWGIGLGVVSAQTAWENDLDRVRPVWPAMIATSLLCAIALLRYRDAVTWQHPAIELMVFVLIALFTCGCAGEILHRRPAPGT
jgi:hypothetical protein